jgi:RimJ/RimL family protein N-acetyltransferase
MQLRSARLTLSLPSLSDLDDFHLMWQDPLIAQFTGGATAGRDVSWRKVLAMRGLWPILNYGYFAVRTHQGEFVGGVGLADYQRNIAGAPIGRPEIGWALTPMARGKGFAKEAVAAVLQWADAQPQVDKTWCLINTDNQRSINLATAVGYAVIGSAQYQGFAINIFERPRHVS